MNLRDRNLAGKTCRVWSTASWPKVSDGVGMGWPDDPKLAEM